MNKNITLLLATLAVVVTATAPTAALAQTAKPGTGSKAMEMAMDHKTSAFKGVEVNKGHAVLFKKGEKTMLRLSSDFEVPNSPAPHWQIVDGEGNIYLLKQLKIAGDKKNLSIMLPSNIKSVKKVQIWCSFAEVLLGEAVFMEVQKLN